MLSEEQIKQLVSENEYLQLQLEEVNDIIRIREEELDLLRQKSESTAQLRSQLEGALNALAQMQNIIGEKQQIVAGSARREAAMENEIIQSIEMEKEFYNIKDEVASAKAQLQAINEELQESKDIYQEYKDANKRIAELESKLDIAIEEKELLNYELEKAKKQLLAIQKGGN